MFLDCVPSAVGAHALLMGTLFFIAVQGFFLQPAVAQRSATDASRTAAAQACAADSNNNAGSVAADDPLVSTAWRLGKLSRGDPYWYRDDTETGEPEISLTDPLEGWKVGVLESGREYFFRATDDGDDTESDGAYGDGGYYDDGGSWGWGFGGVYF